VNVFLTVLLLTPGGYEQEIRDRGDTLLPCSYGETVESISPAIFSVPGWEEESRLGFLLNEDSVFVSVFTNQGCGAVLTVFRKVDGGFRLSGEFTSMFEGNGIEYAVSAPMISGNGELHFRLDWTINFRSRGADSENTESCVSSTELSSFLILATDGFRMWTVYDDR